MLSKFTSGDRVVSWWRKNNLQLEQTKTFQSTLVANNSFTTKALLSEVKRTKSYVQRSQMQSTERTDLGSVLVDRIFVLVLLLLGIIQGILNQVDVFLKFCIALNHTTSSGIDDSIYCAFDTGIFKFGQNKCKGTLFFAQVPKKIVQYIRLDIWITTKYDR